MCRCGRASALRGDQNTFVPAGAKLCEVNVMSTLLIKNIRMLVSCDNADTVYENVDLYAEDGFIKEIGTNLDRKAERSIDASHMLCYPGLVNTHHHLYQVFSRNLPEVQNMELFDWLKTLYEIWKNLDGEVIRLSSLTGMGELMKHGCTTCFDHHYVFPVGAGDLIGTTSWNELFSITQSSEVGPPPTIAKFSAISVML